MPFYLAWIYSNFSRWNFKFFSISDLSYGTNQDFMPFIQAQFFVAQYPQKLHSVLFAKEFNQPIGKSVRNLEATPFLILGSVSSGKKGPVSNSTTSISKSVTGMFCPPTNENFGSIEAIL